VTVLCSVPVVPWRRRYGRPAVDFERDLLAADAGADQEALLDLLVIDTHSPASTGGHRQQLTIADEHRLAFECADVLGARALAGTDVLAAVDGRCCRNR
jgi:hypothetical protein